MPRQKKDSKENHTGKFFVPGVQNSGFPPPPPALPTNKPVSLGDKTDEEIISNTKYQFSIDIYTLLSNSKTTRRSQNYSNEPPRPQNAFILYRRDKHAEYLKENREEKTKQCKFSKEIGPMWKNESPEVKELFRALARTSETLHSKTHGCNYRYSPRRRRQQNQQNRRRRKKNNETGSSHSSSDIDVDSPSSSSTYTPESPSSDYSDMSNILPDVSNLDDASSVIDFSSFGNNNISSYANFNVMSSVTPVEQGLPTSVLQVPGLNEKEFCQIFWLAYHMYMNFKSKNSTSNMNEVVSDTPPEFSEPEIEELFDFSSFPM